MHARIATAGFGVGLSFLKRRSLAKSSGLLIAAGFVLSPMVGAEDLATTGGITDKQPSITKVEDPAPAESSAKERARKRAELEAILAAAKEKEAAQKRERMMESFTVTPEAAQGISVAVDSRDTLKGELAARWRMELYREDEIANKLASFGVKARLRVTWRRQDYDAAATEHFNVILSDAAGKVLFRVKPDYRAPKQVGDGVYLSGMTLNLERDLGAEFRVRVVDGNQDIYADFTVRGKAK